MSSQEDLKKMGDEVGRKISKCPHVKAVAYIGSVATGFVDEFSNDIDIVCICDDYPSIEERRKYLGNQKYESGLSSKYLESSENWRC